MLLELIDDPSGLRGGLNVGIKVEVVIDVDDCRAWEESLFFIIGGNV